MSRDFEQPPRCHRCTRALKPANDTEAGWVCVGCNEEPHDCECPGATAYRERAPVRGRKSPLLRKAPLRSKGLGKNWKHELDKLCRQVVFARDGHRCVMTGQTATIQWCHVKSRRYLSTRWRLENSLTLSAGKHLWAHHNPLEFANWFNTTYPERAQAIALAGSSKQKLDREATRLYLEQELRKWEGA